MPNTWPTKWNGRGKPTHPIVTACTRDETGIDYEVRVTDSGVRGYEEGEGEMVVWSTRRDFGQQEATRAGGEAFRYAAQEQERITNLWAKALGGE